MAEAREILPFVKFGADDRGERAEGDFRPQVELLDRAREDAGAPNAADLPDGIPAVDPEQVIEETAAPEAAEARAATEEAKKAQSTKQPAKA